jgi:hypothetical protein
MMSGVAVVGGLAALVAEVLAVAERPSAKREHRSNRISED